MLHAYSALPTTHVVDPGIIVAIDNAITITVLKQKNMYPLHDLSFATGSNLTNHVVPTLNIQHDVYLLSSQLCAKNDM
jgi:hypothetical protein